MALFGGFLPFADEVNKTADYSVVLADSGTLFTTGGGATRTFTLPALAAGVGGYWAFWNTQANNMVITAPANKLLTFNNLTGTTATFSTASNIIGAFATVWLNKAGTFYYLVCSGPNTVTIT